MSKKKRPITQRTFIKAAAFFLAVLALLCAAASIIAVIICSEYNIYTKPEEDTLTYVYENLCFDVYHNVAYLVTNGCYGEAEEYLDGLNINGFSMRSTFRSWSYGDITGKDSYTFDFDWFYYNNGFVDYGGISPSMDSTQYTDVEYFYIHVYVDKTPEMADRFMQAKKAINIAYSLRYPIFVIGAACILIFAFTKKS